MEWLVIINNGPNDVEVKYFATKVEALEEVKDSLWCGRGDLSQIQIFEAKRKKVVIDIEGE